MSAMPPTASPPDESPDESAVSPLVELLCRAARRPLTDREIADVNEHVSGLDATLGFVYDEISPQRVAAHLCVRDDHRQPFGLVNGGVFASAVESCGSLMAMNATGRPVVGTSNTTDFLRPVTGGRVDILAQPVHIGRTTQLVDVTLSHRGRPVARGRLRTLAMPVAGDTPAP